MNARRQRRHAPRRPDNSTDTPTFQKLLDYESLLRQWSPHITIKGEFDVLSSLFGRTGGMGLRSIDITVGQLIAGNKTFPGLRMSERTCRRHLARLRKRGIIDSHCTGRYLIIRITFDWQPPAVVNPDLSRVTPPDLSRVTPLSPTRAKTYTSKCAAPAAPSGKTVPPEGYKEAAGQVAVRHRHRVRPGIIETSAPTLTNLSAPPAATEKTQPVANQEETFEQAEARQPERRRLGAVLEGQWRTAWAKAFPDILVSVTDRDKSSLRLLSDTLADLQDFDPEAWLGWMFKNWSTLMHQHFAWMGKRGRSPAPPYPSVGFVTRFAVALLRPWQAAAAAKRVAQEERAARSVDHLGDIKPVGKIVHGATNPHHQSPAMRDRPKPRKIAGGGADDMDEAMRAPPPHHDDNLDWARRGRTPLPAKAFADNLSRRTARQPATSLGSDEPDWIAIAAQGGLTTS